MTFAIPNGLSAHFEPFKRQHHKMVRQIAWVCLTILWGWRFERVNIHWSLSHPIFSSNLNGSRII